MSPFTGWSQGEISVITSTVLGIRKKKHTRHSMTANILLFPVHSFTSRLQVSQVSSSSWLGHSVFLVPTKELLMKLSVGSTVLHLTDLTR